MKRRNFLGLALAIPVTAVAAKYLPLESESVPTAEDMHNEINRKISLSGGKYTKGQYVVYKTPYGEIITLKPRPWATA